MIPGYEKIVEERILQAQANGAFDNLEGSGEPIRYEDETGIPEDLRLAYKILKNAGCVPPELETSREIRQTEDLLKNETETEETYRLMKKLNVLMRRRKMETPAFESLAVREEYQARLLSRIKKP
jgi:hypothetical protein